MGTPSSTSQKLVDFVLGSGVELPAADEDAFDKIVERALVNVAFMFRDVTAPTLGNNGLVIFWPEELAQFQGLRVFDLHQVAREDDTIVYFAAYPARLIRVRAVSAHQGRRLVARECAEISRGDLYRELRRDDGDPTMTILKSIHHLIFKLRNRVQKTERELGKKLDRNQKYIDRYLSAYQPE